MYSESIESILKIVQPDGDEPSLANLLQTLHPLLLEMRAAAGRGDDETLADLHVRLRGLCLEVDAIGAGEAAGNVDPDALRELLNRLRSGSGLDEQALDLSIDAVERLYRACKLAELEDRQARKRRRRLGTVAGLVPVLAFVVYQAWLIFWGGQDVVSVSLQWPEDAYDQSSQAQREFTYTAGATQAFNEDLEDCYFSPACPGQVFEAEEDFFTFHQALLKYEEYSELNGLVFRTLLRNRQEEAVPVDKLTLSVSPLRTLTRAEQILGAGIDVSSRLSFGVGGNGLHVRATRPVADIHWRLSFAERLYGADGARDIAVAWRSPYLEEDLAVSLRPVYQDEIFRADGAGRLMEGPLYFDPDQVEVEDMERVYAFPYRGIDFPAPQEDCLEYQECVEAIKVTTLDELARLLPVTVLEDVSLEASWRELDQSEHSETFAPGDLYVVDGRRLFELELSSDLAPGAGNPGSGFAQIISAVADVGVLTGGPDGRPEIEVGMALDYRRSRQVHSYHNEFLASGGWLEVFGHVANLPSGTFDLKLDSAGRTLVSFRAEYRSTQGLAFRPDDVHEVWGFDDPAAQAAARAQRLLERYRDDETLPADFRALLESGDPITLHFTEVPLHQLFRLLEDVADPETLEIRYPEALEREYLRMGIRVEGMPWPQALLLIIEDQGLDFHFEEKTLVLSR